MQLRVMTFNTQHCMNYLTREIDYERMAEAIRECRPDIVALNEMRDIGIGIGYDAQAEILGKKTGLTPFFAKAIHFDAGPYGNALLSRIPIVEAHSIAVPDPDPDYRKAHSRCETRRLLKARLENGLWVLCLHMGLNPQEQENALQTVLSHLEAEKCVLMGDFNVTPDHPVIAALNERMVDTAQYFDAPHLTFPSDAPDRKIDYIFTSRDLTVTAAGVPQRIVSDHLPHTSELDF